MNSFTVQTGRIVMTGGMGGKDRREGLYCRSLDGIVVIDSTVTLYSYRRYKIYWYYSYSRYSYGRYSYYCSSSIIYIGKILEI